MLSPDLSDVGTLAALFALRLLTSTARTVDAGNYYIFYFFPLLPEANKRGRSRGDGIGGSFLLFDRNISVSLIQKLLQLNDVVAEAAQGIFHGVARKCEAWINKQQ